MAQSSLGTHEVAKHYSCNDLGQGRGIKISMVQLDQEMSFSGVLSA